MMPQLQLPIVVIAYNRPKSLSRLLQSIAKADFPNEAYPELVISLDGGASSSTLSVADAFSWPGKKTVIKHEVCMGLRKHVLWCGDLSSNNHGVLILEDDLYVSPSFYKFARAAFDAYCTNTEQNQIASISLYAFELNEYANLPFHVIRDGFDVYFAQTCSSWGQIWSKAQWAEFRTWYQENHTDGVSESDGVPEIVSEWSENSWKKYFNKYMVANNKYSVVPRCSLTTNFDDQGVHSEGTDSLQVNLEIRGEHWRFCGIEESLAVYDAHFEPALRTLKSGIAGFPAEEIEVDLYGTKNLALSGKKYCLSSKNCHTPIASFSNKLKPAVLNIAYDISGNQFHLGVTQDFYNSTQRQKFLNSEFAYLKLRDLLALLKVTVAKKILRFFSNPLA